MHPLVLSLTQAGGAISHAVPGQTPRHHSRVLSFPLSPSHPLPIVSQFLNISQTHLLPVLPHPHPSWLAVLPPPTLHTVATRMTFPSHKFDLTPAPLKSIPGSLAKQDVKLRNPKEKSDRFDRIKIESFYMAKDTINKVKKTNSGLREIFPTHITDEHLKIPNILKAPFYQ